MFVTRFLAALILTGATLAMPSSAHGDTMPAGATQTAKPTSSSSSRLDALREGVHEIDSRSRAIRALIVRERDQRLRRHSRKALAIVDDNRISIAARLDLFQVTTTEADEHALRNMEARYVDAIKVLKVVESWYQKPQGQTAKGKSKKP